MYKYLLTLSNVCVVTEWIPFEVCAGPFSPTGPQLPGRVQQCGACVKWMDDAIPEATDASFKSKPPNGAQEQQGHQEGREGGRQRVRVCVCTLAFIERLWMEGLSTTS